MKGTFRENTEIYEKPLNSLKITGDFKWQVKRI